MHRVGLFLLSLFFFSAAGAQDFTFDELVKLRVSNLSDFETMAMAKGYVFSDIIKDYNTVVLFKKGDNMIIYSRGKNPYGEGTDTIVTYKTYSADEYNALIRQKTADAAHPDITHFFSDGRFVTHVYIDGRACAHFRIFHYPKTVYEVKILPDNTDKYNRYSALKGELNW